MMKKLIVTLYLMSTGILSKATDVVLIADHNDDVYAGTSHGPRKSPTAETHLPFVSYEEDALSLLFLSEKDMGAIPITIGTTGGDIVLSNVLTIPSGIPTIVSVENLPDGDYSLSLEINDRTYTGNFTISRE